MMFQWSLLWVSRVFEIISKGISVKFQKCFNGVSRKFQGCFKKVLGCFKKVLVVSQESFNGLSMKIKGLANLFILLLINRNLKMTYCYMKGPEEMRNTSTYFLSIFQILFWPAFKNSFLILTFADVHRKTKKPFSSIHFQDIIKSIISFAIKLEGILKIKLD